MRLALIVDKEEAYVSFQREELLREWAVDRGAIERAKSLTTPPSPSLFGDTPLVLHELTTPVEGKAAAEAFAKQSAKTLPEAYPSGLIIYTSKLNRNQTKKLEGLVKALGGQVLAPGGKDDAPLGLRLVNSLKLSREVKDFLLAYVGENHEVLLPLASTLRRLPEAQQARVTVEDMIVRMPQPPGAVLPWTLEEPLLRGEVERVVELARRIDAHSHKLVWVKLLLNKFTNYYKVGAVLAANPRLSDEEVTTALGLPARGFYFTKRTVKAYPLPTLEAALLLLVKLEEDLKGGSTADQEVLAEVALVSLCYLLGKK